MTKYAALRRNLISALLVPALGLGAASALGAGESAQKGAQQATQAKQSKTQAQAGMHYMRASEVIGRAVRGSKGNDLGEINDLIVDVKSQRVRYAVLGFGGILGMGEKLFAYPVQAFKQSPDRESFVLNVPEERLERSPGFERNLWPDWNVDDYAERVERFYGDVTGTGQPERPARTTEQQLVRASELIGQDVVDRTGDDIGRIEDLVVNMQNGQIRVAVLDFDRNWGSDELLLPMSLQTFRFPVKGDPVLNVSPDEVDSRLGFTDDAWPDFSDPAYGPETGQRGKPKS